MEADEEPAPLELDFTVSHQSLELEIDFATRAIHGSTTIIINPLTAELKEIPLNFRQGNVTRVTVNNRLATVKFDKWWNTHGTSLTSRQWDEVKEKVDRRTSKAPEPELIIALHRKPERPAQKLKLFKLRDDTVGSSASDNATSADASSGSRNVSLQLADPKSTEERFNPVELNIEFEIRNPRDGFQFVGMTPEDGRYPHAFTTNSQFVAGKSSCLFPCVDSLWSRHTFELTVKFPKTLADAVRPDREFIQRNDLVLTKGRKRKYSDFRAVNSGAKSIDNLSQADERLEMTVVGAGDFVSESVDPNNSNKKISLFKSATPVSPLHIGFAIGPFERVDLTKYRRKEDATQLGLAAVPVQAFCLPGRAKLAENTCDITTMLMDYFTLTFGDYPYAEYRICFVDDLVAESAQMLSISLCDSRVLFPKAVNDFWDRKQRIIAHGLACQWVGINIIPSNWSDIWAIVGIAYFMADLAMKTRIMGNNPYRYYQKLRAVRICEEDIDRPSLMNLGRWILLDPKNFEFMCLKAPVVVFILDRRIAKSLENSGLTRVIRRMLVNAKAGDLPNGSLSTSYFARLCEKVVHLKPDQFIDQWVKGAGTPRFFVQQKFNKKKMVLEMTIKQEQAQSQIQAANQDRPLDPKTFMRNYKEDENVWAGAVQPVFLGPMTIRIHEANGTPYEHIVELQGVTTKFDIPYNTKYKRLKRSKRQKERQNAIAAGEEGAESEEPIVFSFGNVLQSDEEMQEWRLSDWEKDMEAQMENESFEWLRLDADFEWICTIQCQIAPYMHVSQLQQEGDVVAQYEAILSIGKVEPHAIMSTIFVRTIMDKRYFWGIRMAAAEALGRCATDKFNLDWIGLFHLEKAFESLFQFSNDFSDLREYPVQKIIPQVISRVRDGEEKPTRRVREFILNKLRRNDNSKNEFSDAYYIEILLNALTDMLVLPFHSDEDTRAEEIQFLRSGIAEIDRYQRMDIWENSYQNMYTVTALRCKQRLMSAKKVQPKVGEFLPYTKPNNSPLVCVEAFRCLIELYTLKQKSLVGYLFHVIGTDKSPYVRSKLIEMVGQNLAVIAMGLDKPEKPEVQTFLTIEHDDTTATEGRKEDLERKMSLDAAINALRKELHTDNPPPQQSDASSNGVSGESPSGSKEEPSEPLFSSLWRATRSPLITYHEQRELLNYCEILYEPCRGALVRLNYPKLPKSAHHLGDGYIIIQTSKTEFRTTPVPGRSTWRNRRSQETTAPTALSHTPTTITLSAPSSGGGNGHARKASSTPTASGGPKKIKIGKGSGKTISVKTSAQSTPQPASARGTQSPATAAAIDEDVKPKPSLKVRFSFGKGAFGGAGAGAGGSGS